MRDDQASGLRRPSLAATAGARRGRRRCHAGRRGSCADACRPRARAFCSSTARVGELAARINVRVRCELAHVVAGDRALCDVLIDAGPRVLRSCLQRADWTSWRWRPTRTARRLAGAARALARAGGSRVRRLADQRTAAGWRRRRRAAGDRADRAGHHLRLCADQGARAMPRSTLVRHRHPPRRLRGERAGRVRRVAAHRREIPACEARLPRCDSRRRTRGPVPQRGSGPSRALDRGRPAS